MGGGGDELALVTQASWAPAEWEDVSSRGRHEGLTVIGASQRPASIDKHFFSNATVIRTGRLNFAADIKVLANVLHVPGGEINTLEPLQFIQRDMQTGENQRGTMRL